MFYTLIVFALGIFCGQEYTIPSIKLITLGVTNYTINYLKAQSQKQNKEHQTQQTNKDIYDFIYKYTGYEFKNK